MDAVAAARRFGRARQESTLRRLTTFLRFPTVSAEARHSEDMKACAAWLARTLDRIGLTDVEVWRGQVAPVVTAAWNGLKGAPTLLVYGHYDVQPVEPLADWATDPFRPVRDGPYLYARGASDDKGQLMAHLAAIEAWLATSARLPFNLRLVLDGEEEIGSPTLVAAAASRWRPLSADVGLVSDTWMLAPDVPVLVTGLRGMLAASLEVHGPPRDLHAGAFGGTVTNPADELAAIIASLHDKTGRVTVDGFYDQVRPMSDAERRHLARAGPPDSLLLASASAAVAHGEPGYSAFERVTRRPALVTTDLRTSGESRTVVPAWANADLNVRLAVGQDPAHTTELLRRHVQARIPAGIRGRLILRSGCPPYTVDQRAPMLRAVRAACRTVFGRDPTMLPSGGSIPFVSTLAAATGIEVALLGFGLPDDGIHAPNERVFLPNLFRGTDACIELYQHLGNAYRRAIFGSGAR
jgi:acetylornithine deacetylase/succinyl-diaminopimelate desuccinylase-like protein